MENITTYPTIKQAFKSGTGDQFFRKGNKYIAISRHIDSDIMTAQGFQYLTYQETIDLANQQTPPEPVKPREIQPRQCTPPTSYINFPLIESYDTCEHFYDEFPDAYGQHL